MPGMAGRHEVHRGGGQGRSPGSLGGQEPAHVPPPAHRVQNEHDQTIVKMRTNKVGLIMTANY